MTFQASDFKGKQFLDLLNNELYPIELLYTKRGLQLKHFGHSNSIYARVIGAITNYAPIGEYCLCFFSKENFSYLCKFYPIESKCYILHEYRRFNNYQNQMRNTISQLVSFLEYNLNTFSFREDIIQQSGLFACLIFFFFFFVLFLFFYNKLLI